MTREQALSQVAPNLSYFNDCKVPFAISECKSWINKIFDDFEAQMETLDDTYAEAVSLYESTVTEFYKQMKAKNEEVERLKAIVEEAMKPKTCDDCAYEAEDMQDLHCAFCSRSCYDNFEPKENA